MKAELTRWLGEFQDPETERAFRLRNAADDGRTAWITFAVMAASVALNFFSDLFLMRDSPLFWPLTGMRALIVVAATVVCLWARRPRSPESLDRVIPIAAIVISGFGVWGISHRDDFVLSGPMVTIGLVVVAYVLLPNRLWHRGMVALALSAVGLACWMAHPDYPGGNVAARVLSWLVLFNGIGYLVGRRLNGYIRQRFSDERLREDKDRAEATARAKSEFLAMMSHEIRTPMNGILGMARLMLDTRLTAEQRDCAETIHHSGEALLTILNDILDFSKIEAGKMTIEATPVELRRLVRSVADLLRSRAEEKGLALSFEIADDVPPWVTTDPTRLRQVLLNLVGNAVKFTEAGSVAIRVAGDGPRVRFAVADTGIGISEAAQENLFGEFAQADASITRRFGGTGLGLAICKRLVELMDGAIGVDSEEGRGSTFWFELPLPPAPAPHVDAEAERIALAPLDILLAEDNPVNQKVAAGLLTRRGHSVAIAGDGDAAVSMVAAGDYDLVLMDMQMPGVDGIEATRRIRAMRGPKGRIPIVAMTANALKGDEERCLAAGMDGYVAKPVEPAALEAALARHARPVRARGMAPVFAANKLDEMRSLLGPEEVAALTAEFAAHARAAAADIQGLAADPEAAQVLAQDLKALAWTFGAMALGELAEAVELACRDGNGEEAGRLAAGLSDRVEQVLTALPLPADAQG